MLLGIDTCGSTGTVALAQRSGSELILLGETELAGKTYSALLVPRIRELLDVHRVALQELEAIVVVNGPGSFTGVRIGVSAIKGVAEALHLPVVAVSRLAVLAWKAKANWAALDAGRGEFYFGDYSVNAQEALASVEEIRSSIAEPELATCDEASVTAFPGARKAACPRAIDALRLALPRISDQDFNDIASLDGNYLRRSDAELFAKLKVPKLDALLKAQAK
jgi:tRNA threonylcarbamoyladenosine biosynthesis protein TsaB